jgi:hypothetical protein
MFSLSMVLVPAFSSAQAVVIRHDVDDSEYIVSDSDYPALVDLLEPGDCIGTLITEDTLLTVAHCAEELSTSDRLRVDGSQYAIAAITLHPDWDGWDNDIALIRLEDAVVGVDPYPLYKGTDEEGQTISIVGRGDTATGLDGESGAQTDGLLRRATNVVTSADSKWLEVYFEEPGEDGITELEGVGAAGDSGGPCFIETAAGIGFLVRTAKAFFGGLWRLLLQERTVQ